MPKISVIVPVYNAEKFLNKCIDSILSQTYSNFELILVDDGSFDKSGIICDNYAQIDTRVISIHKENGGVSSARNYGIGKSCGEWLCFIDCDDTVSKTYLEDFGLGNNGYQLYLQGFVKVKNSTIVSRHTFINNVAEDDEAIVIYAERHNILNSPCFKLFKRNVVCKNHIRFDSNYSYGEDHLFTLDYILKSNNYKYTMACGYHYRLVNVDSLTQRIVPFEKLYLYSKSAREKQLLLCTKYKTKEYRALIDCLLFENFIRTLLYLRRANGTLREFDWVIDHYSPWICIGHPFDIKSIVLALLVKCKFSRIIKLLFEKKIK